MLCTACLWTIAAVGFLLAAPWENLLSEKVIMEVLFILAVIVKHLLDERNRRIDNQHRQVIDAKVDQATTKLDEGHAKLSAQVDANTAMNANALVHAADATGLDMTGVLQDWDHRQELLMGQYRQKAAEIQEKAASVQEEAASGSTTSTGRPD